MTVTLDWLGCATYRLSVNGFVIFLDTFMDRVSTAPEVGLTSDQVTEADYILVGHAHFDHLAGADVIAKNTGAKVIANHEAVRVLTEEGVPVERAGGGRQGVNGGDEEEEDRENRDAHVRKLTRRERNL